MDRQNLVDILLGIDEEASLVLPPSPTNPNVVIVGGSAFMLRDMTCRPVTDDIDVFQVDAAVRDIISRYPQVNGAVAAYCDQIPYNFQDRLVPLEIGAKRIKFLTPSLEDLAVMKLYAWRPNDISDLTSTHFLNAVDWGLLHDLVYSDEEAHASALSERRWREMTATYKEYEEAWRQ